MRILIVGGGIGGLTTALALHSRGVDCVVYEQSSAIRELGVGINILPHAIKVLVELDLLQALDAVAIRTRELIMTDRRGNEIWREARGLHAGCDVPQFSMHRGTLQGLLYRAVRERLGESAVVAGRQLVEFEQDRAGVLARFCDQSGKHAQTRRADGMIAADGIHSTVRAAMNPHEGPPRWNGVMMWRGATQWPKFLSGSSMIVAGGVGAKLVLYPIAPGATPEQRLTNWAVCSKIAEAGATPPRREDWSRAASRDELQPHLERFALDHVDLRALVAATPTFYEYPMCDRDPLPEWSRERVTLLGDAAHPMYPMGSNGASQAILDAREIAQCLATTSDVAQAFRAYEDARRPTTTRVVQMNRVGGPEGVIDVVERLAPEGFSRIEDVIARDELEAMLKSYATAAGFGKEQVNRLRPP
ncbi:MAG TPA: flavin-dependent oxidoreductase [Steroidobacteraceae bacterium]|nr:flavin-dependent oxidoreductase [Steroidobacteraceae bacterium]